jgi:hypothetical protein
MPAFSRLHPLAAACLLLPLASCASMKKAGSAVAHAGSSSVAKVGGSMSKAGDAVAKFSVSDLMPSKIKVVEVREKDLKEVTLGKDKALAYANGHDSLAQRKRGFFDFFRGPVEFKEPMLPAMSDPAMDEGLLPPKIN